MEVFQFGKTGILLDSLKDLKKSDFENMYKHTFDVKTAWPLLQTQLGKNKKASKVVKESFDEGPPIGRELNESEKLSSH